MSNRVDWRADDESYEERRRANFGLLDAENQAAAIRRMKSQGHGDVTIATATGLSVEFIRRVLNESSSPN
jgi:DNA invertase Pin-like site-specific DNA recombinase